MPPLGTASKTSELLQQGQTSISATVLYTEATKICIRACEKTTPLRQREKRTHDWNSRGEPPRSFTLLLSIYWPFTGSITNSSEIICQWKRSRRCEQTSNARIKLLIIAVALIGLRLIGCWLRFIFLASLPG